MDRMRGQGHSSAYGGVRSGALSIMLLALLPAAHSRVAAQDTTVAVVAPAPADSARAPTRLPLTTVEASEPSRAFLLTDFERRRKRGRGTFFTREELESRGWPGLIELLRGEPGVDMNAGKFRGASGASLNPEKRPCRPVLVLDGLRMTRSDDPPLTLRHALESIAGSDMSAVELYRGLTALPAGIGGLDARCGAILVWTKRPDDELRRMRDRREDEAVPDSTG